MKNRRDEKYTVSNVVQAQLWQKKYMNNPDTKTKNIFPLQTFFDDFQRRNPLGSNASSQKVGGMYASISVFLYSISS